MKKPVLTLFMLFITAVVSAIAVVEVRHQARSLFGSLETLYDERDELNTAWRQLQLEQGALAMQSRVERIARNDIDMRTIDSENTTLIRLDRRRVRQ
ncbi:cell division protein FtsL [Spiribacter vilamensis]|uniref:Cell division protein FtsL n=1 Tax=Spiribacter vilamensis TaxID=531306 RepID=A0A4Q8CY56_9GAMM|nr:cell division protein FtsL [Spiribacter vilamensis]RZU97906.1 cell division protein FtsL [Spiribacter vilamensis]TVO61180.1 cell division protein FtsL [Spiribacter vilamensis]